MSYERTHGFSERIIKNMKSIDLIVPCYNEEAGLEHFVAETNKVIAAIPDYRFRYILVNDGSKDKTYLIMKS